MLTWVVFVGCLNKLTHFGWDVDPLHNTLVAPQTFFGLAAMIWQLQAMFQEWMLVGLGTRCPSYWSAVLLTLTTLQERCPGPFPCWSLGRSGISSERPCCRRSRKWKCWAIVGQTRLWLTFTVANKMLTQNLHKIEVLNSKLCRNKRTCCVSQTCCVGHVHILHHVELVHVEIIHIENHVEIL